MGTLFQQAAEVLVERAVVEVHAARTHQNVLAQIMLLDHVYCHLVVLFQYWVHCEILCLRSF